MSVNTHPASRLAHHAPPWGIYIMRAKYEARKSEFDSWYDVLDAKARTSEWAQRIETEFPERQ